MEACGIDEAPRTPLRDRDAIHAEAFHWQAAALEITEVPTAPQSPWQDPYVERVIGSIGRECLDHVVLLGERHLKRVLASIADCYNRARTHLSLEKDAPVRRAIHTPEQGRVIALKRVSGLHHETIRMTA